MCKIDRLASHQRFFISAYCHLVTFFCFRSITLTVSSYVVAYKLLKSFLILTDVIICTGHPIHTVSCSYRCIPLLKCLENQRELLLLTQSN